VGLYHEGKAAANSDFGISDFVASDIFPQMLPSGTMSH
jgi:hypothetical protein